jgi:hypothetical protein
MPGYTIRSRFNRPSAPQAFSMGNMIRGGAQQSGGADMTQPTPTPRPTAPRPEPPQGRNNPGGFTDTQRQPFDIGTQDNLRKLREPGGLLEPKVQPLGPPGFQGSADPPEQTPGPPAVPSGFLTLTPEELRILSQTSGLSDLLGKMADMERQGQLTVQDSNVGMGGAGLPTTPNAPTGATGALDPGATAAPITEVPPVTTPPVPAVPVAPVPTTPTAPVLDSGLTPPPTEPPITPPFDMQPPPAPPTSALDAASMAALDPGTMTAPIAAIDSTLHTPPNTPV